MMSSAPSGAELGDGWILVDPAAPPDTAVVPFIPLLGEEGPPQCEQLSLAVTLGGAV